MAYTNQDKQYREERRAMVQEQIERRGIHSPRVLEAMRAVPRHLFVPEAQQHWAHSDGALRIGHGQTISQPYIVALMTDLLNLGGDEKVLEVGTGSGYQAAILAHLSAEVHTIERHAALSAQASKIIQTLEIPNIIFHVGDGTSGIPEQAPFQGIMVTAAAPQTPQPLLDQLDDGGRLVLPVGQRFSQVLEVWHRHGKNFEHESITTVAFVPLIGKDGWPEGNEGDNSFWDL